MIAYKEAFFEEDTSSLCLVMEYADAGDLQQRIEALKRTGGLIAEKEIWHVAIKALRALASLHKLKIVHRDIKAANIFLCREEGSDALNVKLGDLNVSKIAKLGLMKTQTGTPYYASPEVWRDLPYDYKCDIWSLGCVLYELAALRPPFMAKDMKGLFQKVTRGVFANIPARYSGDLYFLISRMLTVDPAQRPSAS